MAVNKGGQPTKLNEGFLAKADEYLDTWEEVGDLIPSVAGLAVFTRVSRDSIYEWLKRKPAPVSDDIYKRYSDILSQLIAIQEQRLLNGGLGGTMNATIAKLVLHKHNYSDRAEVDNTSSDGSMSPTFDQSKYNEAQTKLSSKLK